MKTHKKFTAFADTRETETEKPWFRYAPPVSAEAVHELEIFERIGKSYWSDEGVGAKDFAATLSKIPRAANIKLRIATPGGSVADGMLIYNLLAERRANLEVVGMGLVASIGTVIALAGKSFKMPKEGGLFMIHDPWGWVEGNAGEMRKAADMLDKHRDAICGVYVEKTGCKKEDIEKMMSAETWMTGMEAEQQGFADELTDDKISAQASFDVSRFRNAPKWLAENSAQGGEKGNMNKAKIIALLRKRGVTVADEATEEQLMALLEANPQAVTPPPAPVPAPVPAPPVAPPTPSPAPAAAIPPGTRVVLDADWNAMTATMTSLNQERDANRRTTVTARINEFIAQDRIPETQREQWITRALADGNVLNDIAAFRPNPPGIAAIPVEITAEAPEAICTGILAYRAPLASKMRGNFIEMKVIAENAMAMARAIKKHRDRLAGPLNANTIDADLKRNVILSDMMRDFKRQLITLSIFMTQFNNVPQEGTAKVVFPYFPLATESSKDFNSTTGYEFSHDTNEEARTVTVNKRKYQTVDFTSETFRRQPYFNLPMHLALSAEKLALDIWLDVLSLVVASNYANAYSDDVEPSVWDFDNVIGIKTAVGKPPMEWPLSGRALALSNDHEGALLSDDRVINAQRIGSTEPVRLGSTGNLIGFGMFYSPRIPTNSENLAGFAAMPQAAMVATSPIMPAPDVLANMNGYDIIVDPDLGIAFEYRRFGNAQMDKSYQIIECNYGYGKGNGNALLRITNGATTGSSSSSASSVNSSSSTSS